MQKGKKKEDEMKKKGSSPAALTAIDVSTQPCGLHTQGDLRNPLRPANIAGNKKRQWEKKRK